MPATAAGFAAARRLADAGAAVTLTAVYTEGQVLAAAGLGAAYAAPYLGRLDDAGRDGRGILLRMQALARTGGLRLLAASLRSAERVVDLAGAGLDTFTFGPEVAEALIAEPLTDGRRRGFPARGPDHGGIVMKHALLTLAALAVLAGAAAPAAAQSYYRKESALYAEFFGWGGEASANFEKLIDGKYAVRAGVGFTGAVYAKGLVVPFGVSTLLGRERNFLEIGVGGSYVDFDEQDADKTFLDVKEDQVVVTALVGYRFIGDYGFSYRLGFMPAWTKDGFQPMGGAAFGYAF